MTTILDVALDMLARGWAPIPIPYKEKGPKVPNWQHLRLTQESVGEHFNGRPGNIGVLLGEPSGWLVDVDLDSPEARQIAPFVLPPTAVFGRPTSPSSHWLYVSPNAKSLSFVDPAAKASGNKAMLVELRSTDRQTVFPGSTHPSGEPVEWVNSHVPSEEEAKRLHRRVSQLAAVALLLRYWPAKGDRHEAAIAVIGVLARAEWKPEQITTVVTLANGGESVGKHRELAVKAVARAGTTQKLPGIPKFLKVFGRQIGETVLEWLGLKADEALNAPGEVAKLNQQHAVIRWGGRTLVLNEDFDPVLRRPHITLSSPTDFKNFHMARGQRWWKSPHRRHFRGAVFAPGREEPDYYNLWKGWNVTSAPGDWSRLQAHVLDNICQGSRELYDYLLGWMAYLVQHPESPAEVAVVLRGKKGTGKGILGRALLHICGRHGLHISNSKHLVGHFNWHLFGTVFLFADEAFWAGDRQGESVLKTLITEHLLTIEKKGADVITVQNTIHLLIVGNHDWLVPAGLEERRFAVYDVGDARMQQHGYFAAIEEQMKAGGYEAMLFELLNRDLSGFEVRRAPQTAALQEQKLQSMESHQKWWFQKLHDGALLADDEGWSTVVRCDLLHNDYIETAGKSGTRHKAAQTELGMKFKKLLPVGWPRRERKMCVIGTDTDGNPIKERRWHWLFPPLAECRKQFDDLTKQQWPWEDGGDPPLPF